MSNEPFKHPTEAWLIGDRRTKKRTDVTKKPGEQCLTPSKAALFNARFEAYDTQKENEYGQRRYRGAGLASARDTSSEGRKLFNGTDVALDPPRRGPHSVVGGKDNWALELRSPPPAKNMMSRLDLEERPAAGLSTPREKWSSAGAVSDNRHRFDTPYGATASLGRGRSQTPEYHRRYADNAQGTSLPGAERAESLTPRRERQAALFGGDNPLFGGDEISNLTASRKSVDVCRFYSAKGDSFAKRKVSEMGVVSSSAEKARLSFLRDSSNRDFDTPGRRTRSVTPDEGGDIVSEMRKRMEATPRPLRQNLNEVPTGAEAPAKQCSFSDEQLVSEVAALVAWEATTRPSKTQKNKEVIYTPGQNDLAISRADRAKELARRNASRDRSGTPKDRSGTPSSGLRRQVSADLERRSYGTRLGPREAEVSVVSATLNPLTRKGRVNSYTSKYAHGPGGMLASPRASPGPGHRRSISERELDLQASKEALDLTTRFGHNGEMAAQKSMKGTGPKNISGHQANLKMEGGALTTVHSARTSQRGPAGSEQPCSHDHKPNANRGNKESVADRIHQSTNNPPIRQSSLKQSVSPGTPRASWRF